MRRVLLSILTRGRPVFLDQCLSSLVQLEVPDEVELSLLVVDNNDRPEAAPRLKSLSEPTPFFEAKCVWESRQGIVCARNRALAEALDGDYDYIAFIDDDETVSRGWLKLMLERLDQTGADIVTGPVASDLPTGTPHWLCRISLFQPRREHPVKGLISGAAYTGNVLFSLQIVHQNDLWFDEAYNQTGGSDVVFFRRAQQLGYRTAWVETCHVREQIPRSRTRLTWILRRRFRHGQQRVRTSLTLNEKNGRLFLLLLRAAVSIVGGVVALPLCALIGLHKLVDCLGLMADGLGAFAAWLNIYLEDYGVIHGA